MRTCTKILTGGALVAALAAGSLGNPAVQAQEGGNAPAPGAEAPTGPAEDPAALVRALGSGDYAARTRAFEKLREAGDAAREALEEGAKSDDPQVRWSAGRLLRTLDGRRAGRTRGVLRFGESERGSGGATEFRAPRFHDFLDPETLRDAMEGMRRRMADLEEELSRLPALRFEIGPRDGLKVERSAVAVADGERTEVRQDADGRVRVSLSRRGEDGTFGEPEVFEAESLEALGKEHPHAAEKAERLLGKRFEFRTPGPPGADRRTARDRRDGWFPGPFLPPADAKPVLGVTVSPVPEVLRAQLSLGEEEGIVVESVLDGTAAARLGLRRHDVLLGVNGIPVSSADDVRESVGAVEEGADLRLRVLRGGRVVEVEGSR